MKKANNLQTIMVIKDDGPNALDLAQTIGLPYSVHTDLGSAHGLRGAAFDLPYNLSEDAQDAFRASLQHALGDAGDVAILSPEPAKLVLCDMDSTMIAQECLDELADFVGKKPEIVAITERAMAGELDFDAALRERVSMLKGLSTETLEACFETSISLNAGAKTFIQTQRKHGARCVLVSGGFTYFTKRVGKACGFHANYGNSLLEADGKLTGEVGTPILGRDAKAERLLAECAALKISPAEALAIGDGANDLAMIEAAGLGLAYYAKPIVGLRADIAIRHTGLVSALFFQGICVEDWVIC